MPSPLFVSLQQTLNNLRRDLIVDGKEYSAYTSAEHSSALGFRVLASAHIEDYAEKRCVEIARTGILRLKRGQPTRTGQSLITWYSARNELHPIPLAVTEIAIDDKVDTALKTYENMASKKHGISASNLRNLVVPLGVREEDLNDQLFNLLSAAAVKRGAAAHIKVNRAKTMSEPIEEWKDVSPILKLLEQLDGRLDAAVHASP